jgi:lysozyme family protein
MPLADFRSLFLEEPRRAWRSGLGQSGGSWRAQAVDDAMDDSRFGAFRQAWKNGASDADLFGDNPFELKGSVGAGNSVNRRADVAKVETFLGRTGHYKPLKDGPSGYVSNSLDEAIRGFQTDNGLEVDGLLNPGGPTISTLAKAVAGRPRPTVKTLNLPEDFLGGAGGNDEILGGSGKDGLRDAFWRNEEHPEPVKPIRLPTQTAPNGEPKRPTPSASFGEGSLLRLAMNGGINTSVSGSPSFSNRHDASDALVSKDAPEEQGRPVEPKSKQEIESERFERFVDTLWPREGGYSNRPNDKETNHGITKGILDGYQETHGGLGENGEPLGVKDLTRDQAKAIYNEVFYKQARLNEINDEKTASHAFDVMVNIGGKNAPSLIQQAINQAIPDANLEVDGVIGSKTIGALNRATPTELDEVDRKLVDLRQDFYDKVIKADPDKAEYRDGWMRRTESFRP